MALPIGFERKDDRKFEQITIPAASGGSVDDIVKKLVPIAELDPIGQVAFKVSFYITLCTVICLVIELKISKGTLLLCFI